VNTTRIVLAALMIFAAGVLTGGVSTGLVGRMLRERPRREAIPSPVVISPEVTSPAILSPLTSQAVGSSNRSAGTIVKAPGNAQLEAMARWTRELDLTDTQREQIGVLLKSAQARLRDLWAPVAPRARGEIEAARSEIEGLLSPDQRQRWNEARRRRGAAKPAETVVESPHPERAHP
jgi:hypothetical protein